MSLDNEIIKKMLEIINNDHVLMLEIIKDSSLNNEEKPIPKPEEEEIGIQGGVEINKEKENILEKAKEFVTIDKKSTHSNRWITHVKEYAKIHNISYKEALSKASLIYK
jgi:hypothetical protein